MWYKEKTVAEILEFSEYIINRINDSNYVDAAEYMHDALKQLYRLSHSENIVDDYNNAFNDVIGAINQDHHVIDIDGDLKKIKDEIIEFLDLTK